MRVLVVNAFFPPMTTGSAHFSLDMAREYVKLGHEVLVITTQPNGSVVDKDVDGLAIVRIPTVWLSPGKLSFNYQLPFCSRPSLFRQLGQIFREFRPDVIHQHGQFFDLTLATTITAKKFDIPRILTVHTPLTHTNLFARFLISGIDRICLRFFANIGISRIFGVDRFTQEMVQRRYRPQTPVGFIPAALEIDGFTSGNPSCISDELQVADKKVILSFGHVIPIRSRIPLIKALPEILKAIPNAHVVVVGQVYDTTFLDLAKQLGVLNHITVVGRIPHSSVPDYLALADVETHDLDGHGIGITTFEVMAAGIPVIASAAKDVFPGIDMSKWPEVHIKQDLSTHQLALEIIQMLCASEKQIEEIVNQQLDFIRQNFSVEVVATQYVDVMLELCNKN